MHICAHRQRSEGNRSATYACCVTGSAPEHERTGLTAAAQPLVDGRAAAAFFDLDKTVLARSAGLAFARPFYRGGLLGRADVLRSAYTQFVFSVSGADAKQTEAMRRYLSTLVIGWDVDTVTRIVTDALDHVIDPIVHAEAVDLIDEHRQAGRDIVIISASGTEVVEPIGQRLGADLSIGSRMEVLDGRFTGEISRYTHGEAKAEVMRDLAQEHGWNLSECFAYSDSSTDLPMLEAVGHPHAVNPDATLRRIAVERGWPVLEFRRPVTMPRRVNVDKRTGGALLGVAVLVSIAFVAYHAIGKRRLNPVA
jgi:HAD superfamily hydrolase (TIGR01490 family)